MKQTVGAILERAKEQIQANLATYRINASGRTSASLKVEYYEGGVRLVSDGSGAPFPTTEIGREPGGMPPVDAIFQWSIAKGLQFETEQKRLSFAWAVAKTIEARGYGRPSRSDYGSTEEVIYTTVIDAAMTEIQAAVGNYVNTYISRIINKK